MGSSLLDGTRVSLEGVDGTGPRCSCSWIAVGIGPFGTTVAVRGPADHRHITDPAARAILQDSYSYGIISRAISNIALSVVYALLVRALLRGLRWAGGF